MIPSFPNSRWFAQVLKDYKKNSSPDTSFICDCSQQFKTAWNVYDSFYTELTKRAEEWLKLNNYTFFVGTYVLFRGCSDSNSRKIRIDFLSWLIKELKKEELPSARWFKSVLKEFKAHKSRFICHASKKFSNKWDKEPAFTKNLGNNAKVWVQENSKETVIVDDHFVVLFESNTSGRDGLLNDEMKEIKIEFLSWLIKKLEK